MKSKQLKLNISFNALFIPVIAVLILVLFVFILSDEPFTALFFFFVGPFRNVLTFSNMLNASVPLIIGALGVIIAMKAGYLNLGGEGQIYVSAFATTAFALFFSDMFSGLFFYITGAVIAVVLGAIISGLLAGISGFCRAMWNTNELITTFLLSCAVIPIINFFVTGPFLDPETSLISTRKVAEMMRLPLILKPSSLNIGIIITIVFVILVHLFLKKTILGYELRMAGKNELFARYGGINTKFNTVLSLFLSGFFYGLAGSISILGTHHAVIKEFSAGLGWNGLAVALIARFYPPAVIPAALFFAWLESGARIAMQNTGLSIEASSIVQAVILFLCTSVVLLETRTEGSTLRGLETRTEGSTLREQNIFSRKKS